MHAKHLVLRVFDVRAKPGCADTLAAKLADTSIDVVKGQPGNAGYLFGKLESADGNDLVFISVWDSLDAVKRRFGEDWQVSFLPEGYEAMIETCSIKHYTVSGELVF
ncbi:MAG: antibiotic biosynthesis monooxygenase [Pseudomonadota bacterium]